MSLLKKIQIIFRTFRDGIPIDRMVLDRDMSQHESDAMESLLTKSGYFDLTVTIRLTADRLMFVRAICAFLGDLIKRELIPRLALREVLVDTYNASINVSSCCADEIRSMGYPVHPDDKDKSMWIDISVDDLKRGGYLREVGGF